MYFKDSLQQQELRLPLWHRHLLKGQQAWDRQTALALLVQFARDIQPSLERSGTEQPEGLAELSLLVVAIRDCLVRGTVSNVGVGPRLLAREGNHGIVWLAESPCHEIGEEKTLLHIHRREYQQGSPFPLPLCCQCDPEPVNRKRALHILTELGPCELGMCQQEWNVFSKLLGVSEEYSLHLFQVRRAA